MKFNPGIRYQLLWLGILPAGLLALALAVYFTQTRFHDLELALKKRGNLMARQLAAASVYGLQSKSHALLQELTDAALREKDVTEVSILNAKGKLLAISKRNAPEEAPAENFSFTAPVGLNYLPPTSNEKADSTFIDPSTAPLLGRVSITLSPVSIVRSQKIALRNSLFITFIGLLITAVLSEGLGRKISHPLRALTQTVLAISRGRLETRADFKAAGELEELKSGLNGMAAELQKNQENLERQVYKATLRLQRSLRSLEAQNRELAKAHRHAEAQNEMKTHFLAQVSHEIKTPMNGIIGFTERLIKSPLSPEQYDQLRLIEKSAKNLLSIVNDSFDLSKGAAIRLTIKDFKIRAVLEDAVVLLSSQAGPVQITLSIDPAIPEIISADPIRIQQVIADLLSNAIKFTQKGRIIVRARLLGPPNRRMILFSVSDTGAGISEQARQELFSRSTSLSSEFAVLPRKNKEIGLAFAKQLVECMEGSIGVISRWKKGSTFWFTLPLTSYPAQPHSKSAAPFKVILIDSCPLSRKAFESQLLALGAKVSCFNHADAFLESSPGLKKHVIIFVLSDPEPELRLLQRWLSSIKARHSEPILLFGSAKQQQIQNLYKEMGADDYLIQPCRSEYLIKILRSLFKSDPTETEVDSPPPAATPAHHLKNIRLLIADDNEINRILLKAQLSNTGACVTEAENGQEALELIQSQVFDLILLDLQMPILTGLEVMQRIQHSAHPNSQTPIIAVTAHALPEQKQAILAAGFCECLIKPIFEERIRQLIDHWLTDDPDEVSESGLDDHPSLANRIIQQILKRTHHNQALTKTLCRKLFTQLPEQLNTIEEALTKSDYDTAEAMTHQVHGSASFCGLIQLKKAAENLETALIRSEIVKTEKLFTVFKKEIHQFIELKETVFDLLEHDGAECHS